MKVIKISDSKSEIVEVAEGEWTTYRRYSADNWEILMGDSWEPEDCCEDIEEAYQEYKTKEEQK